jgi:hypothetical protein
LLSKFQQFNFFYRRSQGVAPSIKLFLTDRGGQDGEYFRHGMAKIFPRVYLNRSMTTVRRDFVSSAILVILGWSRINHRNGDNNDGPRSTP